MRIITGKARGKKLSAPSGLNTRPTSDAVKEAIFSSIQFEIEGKTVADIFAGSGQLGLEALSRGAKKAYFADSDAASAACIRKNISVTGFSEQAEVKQVQAAVFLKGMRAGELDIIFLDPPYRDKYIEKTLPLLAGILNEGGIVICEHEKDFSPPEEAGENGELKLRKVYSRGQTGFSVYCKNSGNDKGNDKERTEKED